MNEIDHKIKWFFSSGWYKSKTKLVTGCLFVIPLILCLWPFWLVWRTNWNKNIKILLTVILAVTILAIGATSKNEEVHIENIENPNPETTQQEPESTNETMEVTELQETSQFSYELMKEQTIANGKNYYYLINAQDTSMARMKDLIDYIRNNECKENCQIYLYDDLAALNTDYKFVTEPIKDTSEWMDNNYVFVADHLVATYQRNEFGYYPYKNALYQDYITP